MSAPPSPAEVPYGIFERLLHRLAFAYPGTQLALSDIEDRLYRARINPDATRRPVFITSLPRAGTTILLEVLSTLPEFSSATYRQMPFTMLPLLWGSITAGLWRESRLTERAHGDGMMVGFDSAEAFEEVVWMAFWRGHYAADHIRTWAADEVDPEFVEFFRAYICKVVAAGGGRRYLSKNNADIARLGLLARHFPDARIVIPIRDPWRQAASLLRQHLRFLDLHAREPFARRYMEDIGHFEFGEAHRPIAFNGAWRDPSGATEPEYWLRYWADAYEYVLTEAGWQAVFVDHDAMSADPEPHLAALAAALDVASPGALAAAAPRFHTQPPVERPDVPPALAARIAETHVALLARCLGPACPTGAGRKEAAA